MAHGLISGVNPTIFENPITDLGPLPILDLFDFSTNDTNLQNEQQPQKQDTHLVKIGDENKNKTTVSDLAENDTPHASLRNHDLGFGIEKRKNIHPPSQNSGCIAWTKREEVEVPQVVLGSTQTNENKFFT